MSSQLLKKISPATVMGAAGEVVNPDLPMPIKAARVLYDLFGLVVKTKSGHTDKGDWICFIGQFEAVTPEGVVFSAPRAFVQQPFEDMLYSQLAQAQEQDPRATVRFAVRISVVPPTKGKPSAVGYEYRVEPLLNTQENNPLAQLRADAASAQKALAAPAESGGKKK